MFTYALDEYGDFEGLKNTNKPIYIGGVIYDGLFLVFSLSVM